MGYEVCMPKISLKAMVTKESEIYSLDSSVIKYARWISTEPYLGSLEIQFVSGSTYKFYKVPQKVFDDLLEVESAGLFFNSSIRNIYEYKQLGLYKLHKEEEKEVIETQESKKLEILSDTVKNVSTIEKIDSDSIAYVRYQEGNFDIEFNNGNCYTFKNVPELTYKDFLNASPKGTFYNKNINSQYDFKTLDPVTLSSLVE